MKADRLLSIITLLTEQDLISAKRLSEILEVSQRTIYRDIDTLSMAGIPIFTTTGVNGGIGILDSYKVDKQLFNVNDIATLLLGIKSINKVLPEQSLINTSVKIENLIDVTHRSKLESMNQQIVIDPSAWGGNKDILRSFKQIQTSLYEHKVITFTYTDRLGVDTQRAVEAHRLIFKSSRWYFEGYCKERGDVRIFMLQRMSRVEVSEETYILRKTTTKINDIQFQDEEITTATLRVNSNILHLFIAQYGKACVITKHNHAAIIQIPFLLNDWGYRYILSFGEDCECLEPLELREAIIEKIGKMKMKYTSG